MVKLRVAKTQRTGSCPRQMCSIETPLILVPGKTGNRAERCAHTKFNIASRPNGLALGLKKNIWVGVAFKIMDTKAYQACEIRWRVCNATNFVHIELWRQPKNTAISQRRFPSWDLT